MTALIRPAALLASLGLAALGLAAAPAVTASAAARVAAGPAETVVGWGNNADGQLGDGTTTDVSPPVFAKLSGQLRYTTVRAGLNTSVALATNGTVFAWGDNSSGQLGDGTTMPRLTPVRTRLPAGVKVTALREGRDFTVALTAKGKVLAWGNNSGGELGDGTTANRSLPVRAKLPKGVTVTAISAGADHVLALTQSGRVLSWGGNALGQLGDGSFGRRLVPGYVHLPPHTKITSIAAGDATGFAVTSARQVLAWGYNEHGELGDGTKTQRSTPVRVHLPTGVKVAAVTAGGFHELALTTDGRVLGWGDNFYGQLANATVGEEDTAVLIKLGTKVRAVTAGSWYSMVLTTSGHVLAWGRNDTGELGDGSTTNRSTPERVKLPPGFTPTALGASFDAESGLAIGHQVRDGAAARAAGPGQYVVGWGNNEFGQLGNGTTSAYSLLVFSRLPASLRYTTVRSSVDTSVALATSGAVFAWGGNIYGQVGDGTTTLRLTPVRVRLPAGVKVAAVREGGLFTLALTTKGQVLAWGGNFTGELGDGTTVNRSLPVRVKLPKGVTVTAISAGYDSALALTKSGRVLSWGGNLVGQLGNGGATDRHVPVYVRLPAHPRITSIAAGDQTGYAVTSAGRLLAWGANYSGELGDGTTKLRRRPVQVRLPAGVKVTAATAGVDQALALTTGGRALAWGYNAFGQLGDGSTTDNHVPEWVELPKGSRVRGLAAGRDYSMALTTAGRVLAWGHNDLGQLGNGSTTDSATPVRVDLPAGFTPTAIGAGWDAECGLAVGHLAVA
jgi:alpha-tubulin suppressor-like RCC1 family protein